MVVKTLKNGISTKFAGNMEKRRKQAFFDSGKCLEKQENWILEDNELR